MMRAAEPVPIPHPSSTEPAWLTPNQDFVGHSTEPSVELPQTNPVRRHRKGSTRLPKPARIVALGLAGCIVWALTWLARKTGGK